MLELLISGEDADLESKRRTALNSGVNPDRTLSSQPAKARSMRGEIVGREPIGWQPRAVLGLELLGGWRLHRGAREILVDILQNGLEALNLLLCSQKLTVDIAQGFGVTEISSFGSG